MATSRPTHQTVSPPPERSQQRAEGLASLFPPLLVAAERVAATVIQGVHGRRRVGQGETFWQFRRYQPGDAVDKIDWRQSAKTDRVFVRENEWEAAESIWLWRDTSPSMRYRSARTVPEKSERADLLTLALAAMLVRGGEHVALLGEGHPPMTGRYAINRLADIVCRMTPPEEAPSLPRPAPLPRHAQVVLVSDFLSSLVEIDACVRGIAARGVKGHLLQVMDPAEETLPFTGRTRFEGLEREGDTLIPRVESVRQDYQRVLANHLAGLADIARAVGWTFVSHRTDRPPESALLALYLALAGEAEG
jgi:uncharacterized protein (DUF58 family)